MLVKIMVYVIAILKRNPIEHTPLTPDSMERGPEQTALLKTAAKGYAEKRAPKRR
jgi:hypothetical protein